MKTIVLAGGISPERNVSLTSGIKVATALMKKGHEVMLLDLWKGSESQDFPAIYYKNGESHWKEIDLLEEPDTFNENLIGKDIICLCKQADVVFLALHGSIGENGKLQALLEMNGVTFTGTGSVGSTLAMDKALAKRLMESYQISTPKWTEVYQNEFDETKIKYPCVVKPCSCGSSFGVSIVENEQELKMATSKATKYEERFIIEEKIEGREFSIGILNGKAMPIIEIIPETGFYDYQNKYNGTTKEICPANITDDIKKELETAALNVHKALRLGAYSRIDFMIDKENKIYCLEANTLPGMTPMSLFPQEASVMGLSFEDLCEKLCEISKNQ